jgi:transposase
LWTAIENPPTALQRAPGPPARRLEVPPRVEAQVGFGTGARVIGPDGKRRKTHVFRIVLLHSRKAYREVTYRQTTEDFITCGPEAK